PVFLSTFLARCSRSEPFGCRCDFNRGNGLRTGVQEDFSLHFTAVGLRASAPAPRVGEERVGCNGFGVRLRGLPFSLADSGLSMKFRDHPELKSKGFQSWPPLWVDVETKV